MENRRLSLLYNLQNFYNTSSAGSVDYQLSAYLIDNYKEIARLNIFDVSEANNVSRASVRRFCHNLGYQNFKDLKEHFAEFNEGFDLYVDFYSQEHFLHELRKQIELMFKELEERLSNRELKQIVESIYRSDEVVIIASSTIANSIRVFQQTMAIFGKRISIVVSRERLDDLKNYLTNNSLILFFSISGTLAESFIDRLLNKDFNILLFTNSRNPIFNQHFQRIYHLTSMENQSNRDIIYYTYGITYVLDSIVHQYSELILRGK